MELAALELVAILALAGTGLIVTAAVGGGIEAKGIKIPSMSKSMRVLSAFVGVVLLGAAFYLQFQSPPESSQQKAMSATFEYPPPNAQITLKAELRGMLRPASPKGGRYWMVVCDDEGDYYPQARLTPSQSGTWTHSLALGPQWRGRSLRALIVFAPQQADEIFLATNEEQGLSKLPADGVVLVELKLAVE